MDIQQTMLAFIAMAMTMGMWMYYQQLDAARCQLAPYEPVHFTSARKAVNETQNDGNYHHSPLERPENHIRLITLLPGSKTDPIRCKITHVDLNDNPLYKALSYTWGSHEKQELRTITINDLPYLITPNLWHALYHLRSKWVHRILWIDAICINQLDNEEKSIQIQRMREIYYKASLVIVWLGKATPASDLAVRIVTSPPNCVLDLAAAWSNDELRDFFGRSWWSRSWVLQEVTVNGSDPWVKYGDKWIPWGKLQAYYDHTMAPWAAGETFRLNFQFEPSCIALLTIKRATDIRVNQDSLGALLCKSYDFESTDPRDKVYSLLGLATSSVRSAIKPDYTNSVRELYSKVAKYALQDNDISINILAFNTNSPNHDLPSWVPDWSLHKRHRPLFIPNMYKASVHNRPSIDFGFKSGVIKVRGYLLDQISHCDRKSKPDIEKDSRSTLSLFDIIDNIEQLLNKAVCEHQSREARENLTRGKDALWRTLIANRVGPGGRQPPSHLGHQFEVLRLRSEVPASFHPGQLDGTKWRDYVNPLISNMRVTKSRFFITREGRMGLGPPTLSEDDFIVIFEGGDMPFILRKKGNRYQLLGCAYVHGVMKGEAFTGGLNLKREYFTLE